jgi:predicted nucleotidyltransferase
MGIAFERQGMKRNEVLRILAENRGKLSDFSVKSLAIFGSVARDEATDASDVDVLVEFEPDQPVGLFAFIRLMHHLQELLGCKVDLTTLDGLREDMREEVLKEAVRAA